MQGGGYGLWMDGGVCVCGGGGGMHKTLKIGQYHQRKKSTYYIIKYYLFIILSIHLLSQVNTCS